MEKIGIITFHYAENYGAFLQAYAMQEWLKEYAMSKCDVRIIDYRPYYLITPYRLNLKKRLSSVTGFAGKVKALVLFSVELPNRLAKKINFRKAHKLLRLTEDKYYSSDFSLDNEYNAVVLGSDQIWNPEVTKGIDCVYFGTVAKEPCKKISYAASVGINSYSDAEQKELAELLQKLDGVGVREQASIDILQPLCEQEVVLNADPTILANRKIWEKFIKPVKEEKYILIYKLQENNAIFQDAYKLAKETGRIILHFGDPGIKPMYPDVKVKSVSYSGPAEFLSYIRNADLILTNSFHATCFSILFEKQFFVYLQKTRSERIRSMASVGGFKDRLIEFGNWLEMEEESFGNLSKGSAIYNNLQGLRRNSEHYLIAQLEGERRAQ